MRGCWGVLSRWKGARGGSGLYHNLWTACSRMVTFFSFLRVEVLGGGGGSGTSPTKVAHPLGRPSPPPTGPPHPGSAAHTTSPGGRSLTTVHALCASSWVACWSVGKKVTDKAYIRTLMILAFLSRQYGPSVCPSVCLFVRQRL